MELRQLEYFVAVAEEANFTRAAARVHVAQPGVSAQIRRLERELGQELLDRSSRGVRLTASGAAVLPHARTALAAVSAARLAVDELTGLLRGHVTIGTVTSISSDDVDLPALLADFHRDHPAVEITLAVGDSDGLVEALRSGRYDVAFLGLGSVAPPGIATHVVTDEPLAAVVGRADPLARAASVRVTALAERALISLPRGTGLRASLDAACAEVGVTPHVAFEAGDPRVVAQLAARGLGVGVVPRSVALAAGDDLRGVAITAPEVRGRIALGWRAGGPMSPAARALVGRARAVLPDRSEHG